MHDFIAIYSLSIHQLLNVQLAEFPAVLLVFIGVPNDACIMFIFIFDNTGKGHSPTLGLQEVISLLYF